MKNAASEIEWLTFARAVKGTFFSKLVLMAVKLFISAVVARVLGPESRGLFVGVMQASGSLGTAGTMSLGEGLIYLISSGQIPKAKVFGTVIILGLLCTVVVLLLLALVFPILATLVLGELSSDIGDIIWYLAPGIVIEYLSVSAIRGCQAFSLANRLSILCKLILATSVLVTLAVSDMRIEDFIIAFIFSSFINSIIYLGCLFKLSAFQLGIEWGQIFPSIAYSINLHPGTIFSDIENRLDIFLVLYFLNPAHLAI